MSEFVELGVIQSEYEKYNISIKKTDIKSIKFGQYVALNGDTVIIVQISTIDTHYQKYYDPKEKEEALRLYSEIKKDLGDISFVSYGWEAQIQ